MIDLSAGIGIRLRFRTRASVDPTISELSPFPPVELLLHPNIAVEMFTAYLADMLDSLTTTQQVHRLDKYLISTDHHNRTIWNMDFTLNSFGSHLLALFVICKDLPLSHLCPLCLLNFQSCLFHYLFTFSAMTLPRSLSGIGLPTNTGGAVRAIRTFIAIHRPSQSRRLGRQQHKMLGLGYCIGSMEFRKRQSARVKVPKYSRTIKASHPHAEYLIMPTEHYVACSSNALSR